MSMKTCKYERENGNNNNNKFIKMGLNKGMRTRREIYGIKCMDEYLK